MIGHIRDQLITDNSLHALCNGKCKRVWHKVIELHGTRFFGIGIIVEIFNERGIDCVCVKATGKPSKVRAELVRTYFQNPAV